MILDTHPFISSSSPAQSDSGAPTIPSTTTYAYNPPPPPPPPASFTALQTLHTTLSSAPTVTSSSASPPSSPVLASKFDHTLQALTDLTGYIATQTYAGMSIPYGYSGYGYGVSSVTGAASPAPEEEEIRKEIRALKGLVLNRSVYALIYVDDYIHFEYFFCSSILCAESAAVCSGAVEHETNVLVVPRCLTDIFVSVNITDGHSCHQFHVHHPHLHPLPPP